MFEIQISDSVSDFLENYFSERLNNPICLKDRYIFESQVLGLRKTLEKVFYNLSVNPYLYTELKHGVYFVVDTYLSYIMFYTIEGSKVKIFKSIKRDELFT